MKAAPLVLGILIALSVSPLAQARKGEGDGFRGPRSEDRFAPSQRDFAGDPRFQDGGSGGKRRLTPEEARDLRRDIRDAGRDIYRPDNRRRSRD
ncbi:MAG: hypothetical protein H6R11_563 [Proteobacteria bacterium]|jgi:hypothetical protein|nr:hypothetical protein [Pseudomonadota bacterium]MBS1172440.1 hypothetical protein [Pseudomonadota bacterium]